MKQIAHLFIFTLAACLGCDRNDTTAEQNTQQTTLPKKTTQAESTIMANDWPFKDAENTAVITLTRIMNGSQPILYVVHDEDGDWQFLDGGDVSEEDAATVSLQNIMKRDPSVASLADLPDGWAAERTAVDKEWQRFER